MTVTLRGIRAEDGKNGLWEVYSQLTKAPPLSKEKLEAIIDELRADRKREIVVALNGRKVVGTASLLLERKLIRGGALCAHIEDVVVAQSQRGKGTGKLLVNHLTQLAQERGAYKVILDCAEDNVAFYEKCGFEKKEVQMAHYF